MSGKPAVEADLEHLQRITFSYFLNEVNPSGDLVLAKTAPNCG